MVYLSGTRGTLAPALVTMYREANTKFPGRETASDGSIGDADHTTRTSDHNPKIPIPPGWIDALDLDYDQAAGADWFHWAEVIRIRCKAGLEKRVKYIIFFARYFSANTNWEWATYTGVNAHKAHMHTSVNATYRHVTDPWFIGLGLTQEDDDLNAEQNAALMSVLSKMSYLESRIQQISEQNGAFWNLTWLRKIVAEEVAKALAAQPPASGGATGTFDVTGQLNIGG